MAERRKDVSTARSLVGLESKISTIEAQTLENVEWYVSFRSPKDIWQRHPSFLIAEILFYVGGILTFNHARRRGGRNLYLWIATVLHGIVVESVSYIMPEIDNFWHAQSSVMLLGQRLPLHIIFFYPVFLYTASAAVSRLRLSWKSEPFAVGLAVVIMDIPFDILGVKQLWWTWHDTDPNIYDRNFNVPWTSYYFHASFAASLTFIIHGTRRILTGNSKYDAGSKVKEAVCVLMTSLLTMPLGCLLFVPFYHPLHDLCEVHTEIIFSVYIAFFLLVFWKADRKPDSSSRLGRWYTLDEISLHVMAHYITLFVLFLLCAPENIVSEGLHQQAGSCGQMVSVRSPAGVVLTKQHYLCLTNYDEPYFDFHCLEDNLQPVDGSYWYSVCGNAYPSFAEYALVMAGSCFFGLLFFYQLIVRSGVDPTPENRKIKSL